MSANLIYKDAAGRTYNIGTSNTSFLRETTPLRIKGVKNWAFCLRLINLELLRVDPFDKDLSDDLKRAVIEECASNPWYYIREVVRIKDQDGVCVPFIIDHARLMTMHLVLDANESAMTLTPRQTGSVPGNAIIASCLELFRERATMIYIMGRTMDIAMSLNHKVKEIQAEHPTYFFERKYNPFLMVKSKIVANRLDKESVREALSKYSIGSKKSDYKSLVFIVADFAYCEHFRTLVDELFDNMYKFQIVATSVAGCDSSYQVYQKYSRMWDDRFVDMISAPQLDHELFNIRNSFRELNYSFRWARNMLETLGSSEVYRREILLEWTTEEDEIFDADYAGMKTLLDQCVADEESQTE